MSATADKARYFLEQSVPELKEYERLKLFSAEEITSIAKKRSDYEHKINARGSAPSDYAQYAEFEINVDALRRRRVKRLGVKSTAHNGQRRVFFVFDRGTRKFPGDLGLWLQSIEYARKQKAYKKLMQMFTTVLRLHPAKSELWIYAAQFAIDENGDMTEARSYMQRGLRFCKNKRSMWLEYARLEIGYMAKIHARRQVLGVGKQSEENPESQNQDQSNDLLQLPKITAEDVNLDFNEAHAIDQAVLENLDKTPVMNGAIPRAIFDAAMSHFHHDGALAQRFFDMFAEFSQLSAMPDILDHVIQSLQKNTPNSWQTQACYISRPLIGISSNHPEFPAALRNTIKRARVEFSKRTEETELRKWYRARLRMLETPELDPALQQVISAQLQFIGKN